MNYKIIFLIISSTNDEYYINMKKIQQEYLKLYSDKIKYFFIESVPNMVEEIEEIEDHIFIKDTESIIPGIYNKTIKSMNYVCQKYHFDFIIRTNLSSFWNLPNILNLLETKPTSGYAGGYNVQGFITGTGIILSNDIASMLCNNILPIHMHDDVLISHILSTHNIQLNNITEYKWGFMIPRICELADNCRFTETNEDNYNDILYFRLKNENRQTDVDYFNILKNKIYNL